jgi:hypothetical protein
VSRYTPCPLSNLLLSASSHNEWKHSLHGMLLIVKQNNNNLIEDLSRRLYQSFQEWRIRVLGVITEIDRNHLELLATDLRATLSRIEQELENRRTRKERGQ